MTPNVTAVLGATAGALPTLVLALLLERPMLLALTRTASQLRAFVRQAESHWLTRTLLTLLRSVAGGVGVLTIRNWDIWAPLLGVVGTVTSIGLLAVPEAEWTTSDLAWPVVISQVVVVALLGGTVARGAIGILIAARAATPDEPSQ